MSKTQPSQATHSSYPGPSRCTLATAKPPIGSPSFPFDPTVESPPRRQNHLLERKSDHVILLPRTLQGPLGVPQSPGAVLTQGFTLAPSFAWPFLPLVSLNPSLAGLCPSITSSERFSLARSPPPTSPLSSPFSILHHLAFDYIQIYMHIMYDRLLPIHLFL